MDKMSGDRSRSENVTSGPGRGRNPYTNTRMPLDKKEETREREDTTEDVEEE